MVYVPGDGSGSMFTVDNTVDLAVDVFRLSKLTSDKLTADNPNIADLSDSNRPTKLVEMMSELYDNQWTDAYVALQPLKNNDKLVVKILLHTFMVTAIHARCLPIIFILKKKTHSNNRIVYTNQNCQII